MAASLTLILKTTVLPERLTPKRLGVGDGKVDRFGVGKNSVEHAKKSRKLSKSGKSKSKKTSKSRNLAKSDKKSLKCGNSTNFDTMEDGPKILTPNTKIAFNRLWLAFIEALILRHFDSKYYIWIETDVLDYAIGGVLSQLASKTRPDGIVTKIDLSQWHPVASFSRKIILTEIRYETYDGELLAIVKAFKT